PRATACPRRTATLLRYRAAAPPGALPVRGTVHAVRGAVRAGRGLVPAGPGPHAPERSPAPFALTPVACARPLWSAAAAVSAPRQAARPVAPAAAPGSGRSRSRTPGAARGRAAPPRPA